MSQGPVWRGATHVDTPRTHAIISRSVSESFLPRWGWTGVWASGPRGHPSGWVRKRNVPAALPEDTLKSIPLGCAVFDMHRHSLRSYKVTAPPQSLGDASFQQSLQERVGSLGRTAVQPQGAVKDVLKHLCLALAIKWRLWAKRAKVKVQLPQEAMGNKWRHFQLYSPARTASHTAPPPDPTSPPRGYMGCLSVPLEPGTRGSHKRYAWCPLQPPLLYRVQSQSAPRDPRCPAGCSPVWGLWQRHWDKINGLHLNKEKNPNPTDVIVNGGSRLVWNGTGTCKQCWGSADSPVPEPSLLHRTQPWAQGRNPPSGGGRRAENMTDARSQTWIPTFGWSPDTHTKRFT